MFSAFLIVCALLILVCLSGIFGLFVFEEYIKKISCLSVSYTSFLVLIAWLAFRNEKMNEVMLIMVSGMVVFAVNLLIGIGIAKNIAGEKERLNLVESGNPKAEN